MKFYNIDIGYVERLHKIDSEVFFERRSAYANKPYIGIVVQNNNYNYFIPLTSAKQKHVKWDNVTNTNYLIYLIESRSKLRRFPHWIYKDVDINKISHILAVLEIKKMIPVPPKYCTPINFAQVTNADYRNLLSKEYQFLFPLEHDIFSKAQNIYADQKATNQVKKFYCNYSLLEEVYDEEMGSIGSGMLITT